MGCAILRRSGEELKPHPHLSEVIYMFRTGTFVISAWLLTAAAQAQEVLLPSINPTLATQLPAACNAPCERMAALHADLLAVSRMTPLAPAGEVAIYMRQSGAWSEAALLAAPDPDRAFGLDLALRDGDLFASVEPTSEQPGAVYVFRRVGEQWQQQQNLELRVPGAIPQSLQISAIEATSGAVAVGISFVTVVNAESRSGSAVHVFERAKNGRYRRTAVLAPTDAQDSDFGSALALGGNTLVVGTPFATEPTGVAYVFRRGKHGWRFQQKLLPSLPGAQSFGGAVAVSNDVIAIGAPSYFDTIDVSGGLVYLYQSAGGVWQETQILRDPTLLTEPSETNRRFFGTRLALQGSRLMVGVGAGRPVPEEQPLSLLFQLMPEGWQPVAGFSPHVVPVRTQLANETALVLGAELNFGNQTYVYDLPQFSP